MESYTQISKINDYLFCPRSVYLHSIYEGFGEITYHSHYQTAGKIAHEAIDERTYSSLKKYLIGIPVYSTVYGLAGKIDLYDKQEKHLIERKKKVKKVFPGYRYQLYAQRVCLEEMGYPVERMTIRSLDDNKRFDIALPDKGELNEFFELLARMRDGASEENQKLETNLAKCARCIYRPLCRGDVS